MKFWIGFKLVNCRGFMSIKIKSSVVMRAGRFFLLDEEIKYFHNRLRIV